MAASTVAMQLAILRRISERGLSLAQNDNNGEKYIDLFQHLLDEIYRTKRYYDDELWKAL